MASLSNYGTSEEDLESILADINSLKQKLTEIERQKDLIFKHLLETLDGTLSNPIQIQGLIERLTGLHESLVELYAGRL
jgi:hypothetical protein